jgi:hypothetical protein
MNQILTTSSNAKGPSNLANKLLHKNRTSISVDIANDLDTTSKDFLKQLEAMKSP